MGMHTRFVSTATIFISYGEINLVCSKSLPYIMGTIFRLLHQLLFVFLTFHKPPHIPHQRYMWNCLFLLDFLFIPSLIPEKSKNPLKW